MRTMNEFLADAFKDVPNSIEIESKLLYSVSNMIFRKRKSLDMSQKDFAKFMGVSQGIISKWESCEYNYSIQLISEIAEKLSVIPALSFDDRSLDYKNQVLFDCESNTGNNENVCSPQLLKAG